MKATLLYLTFLGLFLFYQNSLAKYHNITNNDGHLIEAKLIEGRSPEHITLKRKDGRIFKNIPVSQLSPESQQLVANWQNEITASLADKNISSESEIEISFSTKRNNKKNDYNDIDDRVVSLEPAVTLKSDELLQNHKGIKGTMVVLGVEALNNKVCVILNKEDFTVDLPAKEEIRWEGTNLTCTYDPDYGGFKYLGDLVVLRNDQNEIVLAEGSSNNVIRNTQAIFSAKKYRGYDRNFAKKSSLRTTWGLPRVGK